MRQGTLVLVAVLVGGSFILGKTIERTPFESPLTVSVIGNGKVSAPPDVADLTFGVVTATLPTTQEAMVELTGRMNAAVAAVKGEGVEERDIKTVHFSLHEVSHYREGNSERIHDGWAASEQLNVTVRDLAKVGNILQAAVGAGANQAGEVSFRVNDPETLQADARAKAVAEAEKKAKELANLLDKRLGELKGYRESEGGQSRRPRMDLMADSASGAPPILGGEEDIVVVVGLTYELR